MFTLLGKSGDENNMLANESKLKEIDATFVKPIAVETLLIMVLVNL